MIVTAKIQGPQRTEFVLEYRDSDTRQSTRVRRINLHELRTIAERVVPELVWKDWRHPLIE